MPHIIRDVVHLVLRAVPLLDKPRRRPQYRQRTQPQKVYLQQADRFHDLHRPLRDAINAAQPRFPTGRPVERHIFHQRLIGNDHPGGMAGRMARHPF